jgi:hypothetical protein
MRRTIGMKAATAGEYRVPLIALEDLDRSEWIHQPGLTLDLLPGIAALLEYDLWRVRTGRETTTADRSLNLVLHVSVP